ncbi:MAG: hypothetical protein ACLPYB_03490 [Desulfobaccales bacterium]
MKIPGTKKLLFGAACLLLAAVLLSPSPARAGFSLGDAELGDFGILYEGNGGHSLQFNNSTEWGNIGIGGTGAFQGNGPGTITGDIEFSAASSGQFSNSGLTINGTENYSVPTVTSALSTVNTLSQNLGIESGTSTTITSGGSINASSGTLDGNGNRVFTVTSISFANGTFTINGSSSDYVVLNIAGSVGNNGLNGSIVLTGGITIDHVLINYTPDTGNMTTYNNDYTNLSGGPTLTISTNGLATEGIFLDPTGNIQVNHSDITGAIYGGDSQNLSFVSGAHLVLPLPPTAFLLGSGLLGLIGWRRTRKG